jgi:salicylate hydroxylase
VDKHILIAGAGIGGIVAALALVQKGFKVSLYEQAAELHELGAGVQISPNGSCVLHEIGMQPAMEAIASRPTSREMRLYNTEDRWVLQNSADALARYGAPFWLVHRGDLHQALATALAHRAPGSVRVGARCVGFEQDAEGVTLLLESGEQLRGDVLIGADGVHSRTRETLFSARATFTGFIAWRGVVPMERLPARLRQENFTGWMGPTGLVVTYPMRGGELLNFVGDIERSDWVNESWSEAGTIAECQRDFDLWHDDVQEIIRAIKIPYKWALVAREPLGHWSVG